MTDPTQVIPALPAAFNWLAAATGGLFGLYAIYFFFALREYRKTRKAAEQQANLSKEQVRLAKEQVALLQKLLSTTKTKGGFHVEEKFEPKPQELPSEQEQSELGLVLGLDLQDLQKEQQ